MTTIRPHHAAFGALLPVLLAGMPASAQTVVDAPPVTPTIAVPPAAPVAGADTSPARGDGIGDPDSPTPIAPEALRQAEAANAERAQARREARAAPARSTRVSASAERAATAPAAQPEATPAQTSPVPTTTPAAPQEPVAATPAVAPMASVPAAEEAPAPAPAEPRGSPVWPWLAAGAILLIGLAGLLVLRRRRDADVDDEPYVAPADDAAVAAPAMAVPIFVPEAQYEEQVVAAPVAAASPPAYLRREPAPVAAAPAGDVAPVAAEAETLAVPADEEVAALTAGDPPVADRPWLELAMRPLRAGTNIDEAVVEIELIVGNSGQLPAENVRIATFMFAGTADQDEVERLLIERGDDGAAAVTIAPGAGTQLDATLAMPKGPLAEAGEAFVPVVVADARYTMPDGSEGHTSATFRIGLAEDGTATLAPIPLERASMREDVGAELAGEPAHA